MPINDYKPDGYNENMATFARWARPARVYVQGGQPGDYMIWLDVDGIETILGIGQPNDAITEALGRLDELKQQATQRLAELMAMRGDQRPTIATGSK